MSVSKRHLRRRLLLRKHLRHLVVQLGEPLVFHGKGRDSGTRIARRIP